VPSSPHVANFPGSPPLDPRHRGLSPTSSDCPLFSSDDPIDGADITNYESPRFKRKRAGPWWERDVSSPLGASKKTKFSRNFDSGVWMMSDGSDSLSAIDSEPPSPALSRQAPVPRATRPMSDAEACLHHILDRGIESNNTTYELDHLDLEDSELHHIELLNQVIVPPLDAGLEVPTEGQYRSMIPELHVSLASNHLLNLSTALFNVDNLTSLTLRGNYIEEVPPMIVKLQFLRALDLTNNAIKWLPCEMITMMAPSGRLARLTLHGNPLLQEKPAAPAFLQEPGTHGQDYRGPGLLGSYWRAITCTNYDSLHDHHLHSPRDSKWQLMLKSRTPPSYYDSDGNLLKGSPSISAPEDFLTMVLPGVSLHDVPAQWFRPSLPASNVLSLFAMSLIKSLSYEDSDPKRIRALLSNVGIPPSVDKHLQVAERNRITLHQVLRSCHRCGKDYYIPRAEWIEMWIVDQWSATDKLPFKVSMCSWACVPESIGGKPHKITAERFYELGDKALPIWREHDYRALGYR